MVGRERDPGDLLIGGALIVLNLGLAVAGAGHFGGGLAGFVAYILVPSVVACAASSLLGLYRRQADRAP